MTLPSEIFIRSIPVKYPKSEKNAISNFNWQLNNNFLWSEFVLNDIF